MLLLTASSLLLLSTSFLFSRIHHPLAMGLTLITQTLLVCLASGTMSAFNWFSYILFLIFLGATLVLFIYIASLASNEMFKLSYRLAAFSSLPIFTILPLAFFKDKLFLPTKLPSEPSFLIPAELTSSPIFSLSMVYNPASSPLTAFVILYLLLTLIVVVKITSSSRGPLRLS